jgi:2-polyprenyl-3-methyl-5-hydroxy-6-metoxy-1,4-benzoquinol methylase
MTSRDEITAQNRRAWDEIAEVRGARWEEKHPAGFFRDGGCLLSRRVRDAAGDVRGKTVLHVLCATGEETLSWAVLGARATGVDISARQIEIARAKAAEAGLEARFVASDVYELPEELRGGSFDVVYTGGGVLCWLPDLDAWAEVIAAAMRAGGLFVLDEEHPIAQTLWVADGEIRMTEDYFQRGRAELEPPGWSHFDDKGGGTEPKYEFVWPLGDVVTAVARAGLRVVSLEETPTQDEQRWRYKDRLEAARGIPGGFTLVARKDEATLQGT